MLLRYMDELMRLKAAARAEGSDYLTWNDIQACIDQVNLAVQEEHERKRQRQNLIDLHQNTQSVLNMQNSQWKVTHSFRSWVTYQHIILLLVYLQVSLPLA